MMKIGHFVAFAAFAAISASCIGSGEDSEQEALDAFRGTMQECHTMEARLRGRGASLWKVLNAPDLVAVQIDDDIVCVDTVESGDMTKDLALLVGPQQPWLTTEAFIARLAENLKPALAA